MDRTAPDRGQELELDPMYTPDTPAQSVAYQLFSWLQPVLFALAVLVVVSTFLGRLIGVDGLSMYPTLHDRDMLLLQSIGYTPRNDDVVVLAPSTFRNGTPIVKRVIATGGQTVDVDYDAGTVTVDGEELAEPYLGEPMRAVYDQFIDQYPVTVPEGCVFVMGDNRNASSDSRVPDIGMVDQRCVLGRAIWIVLPFGRFGGIAR